MMTPLSLEAMAHDLVAERIAEAERQALIAQLPRQPRSVVSPFALARARLADGLRSVARRLDPTFAVAHGAASDRRLLIARSR